MTDIKPLPLAEGCPVGRCFFMFGEKNMQLKIFTAQDTTGMIPESIFGFVNVEITNPTSYEKSSSNEDCKFIVNKVTKKNIIIYRESGKTFIGGSKTKQIPVSNFYGAGTDFVIGSVPVTIESGSAYFNDTDKQALQSVIDTFIKEIVAVVIRTKNQRENAYKNTLRLFEEAKKTGDIFNSIYQKNEKNITDGLETTVGKKHIEARSGIDIAIKNQTIEGDYDTFIKSLEYISKDWIELGKCYKKHPAIINLCEWWNTHAPEEMRFADFFRVYVWDEKDRVFIAGDDEEPSLNAEEMATQTSMSVFHCEGKTTFAAIFFKGKEFKKDGDVSVNTDDFDESFHSAAGLKRLLQWV